MCLCSRPLPERRPAWEPYILCVARFDDPRKNIGLLLEAYAYLPDALRASTRLVLAGASGLPESFWRRAKALELSGRITYLARPSSKELVRAYQRASVFALPSDEEGLGVVLLEAMACGVPAVSTKCGGPDGIITDGSDGYLVALGDAMALSARIRVLLEDTNRNVTMGIKARRTIEARFDEHVTAEAFLGDLGSPGQLGLIRNEARGSHIYSPLLDVPESGFGSDRVDGLLA